MVDFASRPFAGSDQASAIGASGRRTGPGVLRVVPPPGAVNREYRSRSDGKFAATCVVERPEIEEDTIGIAIQTDTGVAITLALEIVCSGENGRGHRNLRHRPRAHLSEGYAARGSRRRCFDYRRGPRIGRHGKTPLAAINAHILGHD